MVFSETVLNHYQSPRNMGRMPDADAEASEENPVCGDVLHMWLRIRDGVIDEASWEARGCAPALAAASVTSELVRGMALAQARVVDRASVMEALGGLPARKEHAAILAATTLRRAIESYLGEQ
jgi:nitrogen fixation NifU-like protein